jgi:hypothetical protein
MSATAGTAPVRGDGLATVAAIGTFRNGARVRIALLVALLPLFGQTFHYMKDLRPLWALSKAFPLLSLPLALVLLVRSADGTGRLPRIGLWVSGLWLGAILWLVLVSSWTAMFSFDQSFLRGLTAQIKLLPMLYFASFLGLLLLIRPTLGEIERAFIWIGLATFAALLLLWAFAPQSWYATKYEFGDAPLLSVDDRGNRIRMPMYFGMIILFAAVRRLFWSNSGARAIPGVSRGRAAWLIALMLAIIVGIVRTRATVLATSATIAVIAFIAAPGRWRIGAVLAALIGAVLMLQIPYVQSAFDTSSASGFDVRATTVSKAFDFLGSDPVRWLFGVGTISSLDPAGLPKFFNHFFFLADISWLGIVFEFGLIGAFIMVVLMVTTLASGALLRARTDSPMLAGLQDYVLFTLIISPLYATMTLQPGEVAVISAVFIYGWIIVRDADSRKGASS